MSLRMAQVVLDSAPDKQMSPHNAVSSTCVGTCRLACTVKYIGLFFFERGSQLSCLSGKPGFVFQLVGQLYLV